MKFIIGHSELKDLSSTLSKYTKKAGNGYGYLQITAKNGLATFKTSNEVETVITEYPVDKCYVGSAIIEAEKFLRIVKTFYDLVNIEVKDNLLEIKSKGSKYRLPILSDVAFFCLEPLTSASVEVDFSDNIGRIRHSLDTGEYNNAKQYFWFNNKYIVSTNGYMISEMELPEETKMTALITPSSLKDVTGKVELRFNNSQFDMKFGNIYVMSRLNEGNIPNYKQIMPNYTNFLTVERKLFLISLNRISDLSSNFYIKMFTDENKLVIVSECQEGNAEEVIDCEIETDLEFSIGMNYNYLVQSVGNLKGDKVRIYFQEKNKSIVVKSPDKPEITYVIMPIVK